MENLTPNDRVALELLQCYSLYSKWSRSLLLNYGYMSEITEYGDTIHNTLDEIEDQVCHLVKHMKEWYRGIDISNVKLTDLSVMSVTGPTPQDRGVLTVLRKMFSYFDELHGLTEDNEAAKADRLLRLIQRCGLLIDLWHSGEDLTYYGAKLDLR